MQHCWDVSRARVRSALHVVAFATAVLVLNPQASRAQDATAASSNGTGSTTTEAQPQPQPQSPLPSYVEPYFRVGSMEWMITTGIARGIVIFHSAAGHNYFVETFSVGRILTEPHLNGALRGRFEWALEAVPVYGQSEPTRVYGFGFSPLVWRWNFEPRGRYAPYAELAGGGLWTNKAVPDGTTKANFTAHTGGGVRVFFRSTHALVLGYRLDHISNGNRLERNPGVNAHALHVGWTMLRPRW